MGHISAYNLPVVPRKVVQEMVEDIAVEVTHVFGVKVVLGLVVNFALFKGVFHFFNGCENLFAGETVLPYGLERVD
jgi:hypothetical protein